MQSELRHYVATINEGNEQRFVKIEEKLNVIASMVGAKEGSKVFDDLEERKRLKERLKAELEKNRKAQRTSKGLEKESWIEYIFGIGPPDGRVGKDGSRFDSYSTFSSL